MRVNPHLRPFDDAEAADSDGARSNCLLRHSAHISKNGGGATNAQGLAKVTQRVNGDPVAEVTQCYGNRLLKKKSESNALTQTRGRSIYSPLPPYG